MLGAPLDAMLTRILQKYKEEPSTVLNWQNRNKAALLSYWALDKSGALAIKAEIEKLLKQEGENETSEEGPAQGSESRGHRRK